MIYLFSTPLVYVENCNLDLEQLERKCREHMVTEPSDNKSNIGGYQTSDVLDNEIANLLAPYVYKGSKEITNVTKNIYFGNLWINENMKGDYNALHCHPGSQYAAVYYRDVPKDSGNLVFYRSDMSAINMAEIKDEIRYIVHPKKGLLIIFPAYLTHLVNPNKSDKSRVSISFNFSFK